MNQKTAINQKAAGGSISGVSLFSHLLKEMAHIIQITDRGRLQCLTIEFALPAGRRG
jgi:hypothetical protein